MQGFSCIVTAHLISSGLIFMCCQCCFTNQRIWIYTCLECCLSRSRGFSLPCVATAYLLSSGWIPNYVVTSLFRKAVMLFSIGCHCTFNWQLMCFHKYWWCCHSSPLNSSGCNFPCVVTTLLISSGCISIFCQCYFTKQLMWFPTFCQCCLCCHCTFHKQWLWFSTCCSCSLNSVLAFVLMHFQ